MHAEQLQDDRVWELTRELLTRWGGKGRRWTLFVQPLRARAAGFDLAPRLNWIRDNGHEIAMHTHFYRMLSPVGAPPVFEKQADLRTPSVLRCLEEDYTQLVELGHRPRGFVAGAWLMHEAVPSWLAAHGFDYDCSRRAYPLGYPSPAAGAGDNHFAIERVEEIVQIPTTATVRALATARAHGGRRSVPLDAGSSYEMFYLHDYDLARLRPRLAVQLVERVARADHFALVSELSDAHVGVPYRS